MVSDQSGLTGVAGLDWSDLLQSGWLALIQSGLVQSGLILSGQVRSGLVFSLS